jgi:3-hydroxyisobutyrate dehydrogenase
MRRIGFAGLGRMGAPMARNLAASGTLTLWNRTPDKARALAAELVCETADTPRALSEASDVVVTMLADDASSEAVHLGQDGLFAGGARTYLEMGTMSPDHIASLVDAAPSGALVVDAPVSGATQAAADAALLVMAGCAEEEAADVAPLLAAMGRRTVFLGRRGAGAVMKLAVNALIHGLNQTLAEAMTLAEAAGIAPDAAFDVIEDSAAGAPMLRYRRPLYLGETGHDVTFALSLALKDMEVMTALADRLGVATPQGDVTRDALRRAAARGYGARDMAAMLDYMRKETS